MSPRPRIGDTGPQSIQDALGVAAASIVARAHEKGKLREGTEPAAAARALGEEFGEAVNRWCARFLR